MSTSAASSLPPAFPGRAPWGTAAKLRAWQAAALEQYLTERPRDFLAVATPGAGKTTFALRVATELLGRGEITRVTVVAPTEHLKRQWADAAHRVGIRIDPEFKNAHGSHGRDFDGVAVTYAQVASRPLLHRARTEAARTLVILDEVHHGGGGLACGGGGSVVGARGAGGVRAGRPAPGPHRDALPARHSRHPVRRVRRGRRRHP